MSDGYDISRRKVLGGLATIGAAGAGAGMGTTAYFSDTETFDDNQLVAGELDLKVGYEEHYSVWADDENDGLEHDVQMEDGGDITNSTRVGLPANRAAMISVKDAADAEQFLDNTQVQASPRDYDSSDFSSGSGVDCSDTILADDDDLEQPVIDLGDVKPGDFGEVTFSFAICDNPGYVWAQGFLQDASENGYTEPEREDPDESGDADGDGEDDRVELLDGVRVAFWLDDGNNFQNGGEEPLFVGTLREVLNGNVPQIDGTGVRIDGRNIPKGGDSKTDLTAYGVKRFDASDDGNYDTDMELAEDPVDSGKVAHATSNGVQTRDYVTSAVNVDTGATVDSHGLKYDYLEGPNNDNVAPGAAPDEVILRVEDDTGAARIFSKTDNDGTSGEDTGWTTRNVDTSTGTWVEVGGSGDKNSALTDFTDVSSSSEINAMAVGRGFPTSSDGVVNDVYYRNPMDGSTDLGPFPTSCFRANTAYNGVFAWWLPVDHANEIQTDSATFSLGLYTEQCRHNDGSGEPPTPSAGSTNNSS